MSDVTHILDRAQDGDPKSAEELLPLVYDELRKLAAHKMAAEASGHTLQPTALVHEAWLRLAGSGQQYWNSRGHFFAAAAEAMRRILIDTVRRKRSLQRGGNRQRVELDESSLVLERPEAEMLDIDAALDKLARKDPMAADLVKMRYFVGFSIPEAAAALNIAPRTADRLWAYSRSWLREELQPMEGNSPAPKPM